MAQLKSTNITGNLAVTGKALASEFKKLGSTSNDVLLGDGSITTLSAQTTAPVAATTTANRTYKIQKNGNDLVVNVPWEKGSSTAGTVTSIAVGTGLTTSVTNNGAITTSGTISLDVAGTKTALGLGTAAYTNSNAYATSTQGSNADTAYGWGNHANAGYLPLTAGYDKQLSGILYANKPIGIRGTFDNNVVPTEVQGVAYLAYNSSSKSLDFIFN